MMIQWQGHHSGGERSDLQIIFRKEAKQLFFVFM
jgi:hypothetical protein